MSSPAPAIGGMFPFESAMSRPLGANTCSVYKQNSERTRQNDKAPPWIYNGNAEVQVRKLWRGWGVMAAARRVLGSVFNPPVVCTLPSGLGRITAVQTILLYIKDER